MERFDLNAFTERLNSESDRACAVLGAALLDAKLEELFRRRLQCYHDELLESTRPLGTFAARIQLAKALAWIDDDARVDLDNVRSIRNDFAHSFDHDLSFKSQSVADRCRNLRVARAFIDGFDLADKAPNQNLSSDAIRSIQTTFTTPRWRYQLSVEFLAQYLDDLREQRLEYSGPNLIGEVRSLSANTRLSASMTGTVSYSPGSSEGEAPP